MVHVWGASQVALVMKYLPAMQDMQEAWVRSLGGEDPLEKKMATHSITLACLGREHRECVQIICLESQHTRGGQWR